MASEETRQLSPGSGHNSGALSPVVSSSVSVTRSRRERARGEGGSRSGSGSRSRSYSPSGSRHRSRSLSRSRHRTRSPSGSRHRTRSASGSRSRSPPRSRSVSRGRSRSGSVNRSEVLSTSPELSSSSRSRSRSRYRSVSPARSPQPELEVEVELQNEWEGKPEEGRQLSEKVSDFTVRLQPSSTPATGSLRWIWCANPRVAPHDPESEEFLKYEGRETLKKFLADRQSLEKDVDRLNELEKKNKTYKQRLESMKIRLHNDIIMIARKYGVKRGKWLVFCERDEVDRLWHDICQRVVDGRLGTAAKVARSGSGRRFHDSHAICVYTHDFDDWDDVERVLKELETLGLLQEANKKPVLYKNDAFSLLDLDRGNEYGMATVMWDANEVMGWEEEKLAKLAKKAKEAEKAEKKRKRSPSEEEERRPAKK